MLLLGKAEYNTKRTTRDKLSHDIYDETKNPIKKVKTHEPKAFPRFQGSPLATTLIQGLIVR